MNTNIPASFYRRLAKLMGQENIHTDELSLALYAYDCSLSRTRPDGVILVKQAEKIPALIRLLNEYKIPFIPRASATNHAGSCAALNGGFILNLTHLNRILEINTHEKYAVVEPAVITGDLQRALEKKGFFYAPDPASADVSTLGGNVAQNASGARCLKYGNTLAHVLEADVVWPDGTTAHLSRQTSGLDALGLLAGSEGTLGILTRLKVKILPTIPHIQTFLVTFPSLEKSIQAVSTLVAQGIIPRCVEAMDKTTTRAVEEFAHAHYPTDSEALLILELDGTPAQIQKESAQLEDICRNHQAQTFQPAHTPKEREDLWRGRRAAYAAMARLAPNVMVGDGTVPRSELPRALKAVQQLLAENHSKAGLLFHAGDGNFHPQLVFDERNKPDTARLKKVLHQILQICLACGGTLSGEHGVGVEKRALMAQQYNAATLRLMAQLKDSLDPLQLANPLKIIPLQYEEKSRSAEIPVYAKDFLEKVRTQTPFHIVGNQTQGEITAPHLFSTLSLNKLVEIDTANYTVTTQAGIAVSDLISTLKSKNLYCALPETKGTLGGLFCGGHAPAIYPHVLGIEGLLPDGSFFRYGGKFVKNAAGYNLVYLLGGSQGKLGLVTQLTLRIFSFPVEPAPLVSAPRVAFPWENRLRQKVDPQGVLV